MRDNTDVFLASLLEIEQKVFSLRIALGPVLLSSAGKLSIRLCFFFPGHFVRAVRSNRDWLTVSGDLASGRVVVPSLQDNVTVVRLDFRTPERAACFFTGD